MSIYILKGDKNMAINENLFIHDSDKAALDALKSIPGFTALLKAFMKIWNEQQFKITNMSSNIRVSEEQMPKYYHMLEPICKRLNINKPELYVELNPFANAYTYGDTEPFIVLTSGLLETLPDELIPSVLAHECGHIVCHHTLYHTMGKMILDGTFSALSTALGLGSVALYPIQIAFAYWMRCSEFSADRAAVVCDGTAIKTAEVCARLAGFDKDVDQNLNMSAFLKQADEYYKLVGDNLWNKTLEFLMYKNNDHPLTAVRAFESMEWEKSVQFNKIINYLHHEENGTAKEELPFKWCEKQLLGRNYEDVRKDILNEGFLNIELNRFIEKQSLLNKPGDVLDVKVNGKDDYKVNDWIGIDSNFVISYYLPYSEDEIAAMHPGEAKILSSSKSLIGKDLKFVVSSLKENGFTNISIEEVKDILKDKDKNLDKVANVSINKQIIFTKGDWFKTDSTIVVTIHKRIEE